MKKHLFKPFLLSIFAFCSTTTLFAAGAGTSGGLTLIESYGARSAALGEAFTPMVNDIAAMGYNPASLGTLKSGQASFMYQKGMVDDSYGQFLIGAPMARGGWGLSVGYYNAGTMDISFDGVTSRSVSAQKDLTLGLGYARNIGSTSYGLNFKYLRSEIIEMETAQAYAVDLGLSQGLGSRLRFGAALQNFGTQLKFVENGDELPRIARAGVNILVFNGKVPVTLLLDAPYYMNERELRPATGLEFGFGLLALRAGYKKGSGTDELSFGTGFLLGRTSLDYSFGLVQNLDAQHRVSLSLAFGGGAKTADFAKKKEAKPKGERVVESQPIMRRALGSLERKPASATASIPTPPQKNRIYIVQPGDSLGKISAKFYGRQDLWKNIYTANKHLLNDPRDLEVGQKIVIPK